MLCRCRWFSVQRARRDFGIRVDNGSLRTQKYPGFADRVHEGLQDIFGDKGLCVEMVQRTISFDSMFRLVFRGIVTHHAEDGSGIGSAIIAGELPALLRAGLNLTCDPSDDEEEEGGRTVSELLRKSIQSPIEFAGHPLPNVYVWKYLYQISV